MGQKGYIGGARPKPILISNDSMFYVHFLKLKLKWISFEAIKSISIYLWFGVIL